MQVIKFRNVDTRPIRLKNRQHGDVTLKPGQETVLPLAYATVNLGNPYAQNVGRNREREEQFKDVRRRWGFYPGLMPESDWDEIKPKIELYTLDGERLYSVIEDPDGVMSQPVIESEDTSTLALKAQLVAMQKQIEQLTAVIAAQQTTASAPTEKDGDTAGFDPLAAAVEQVMADRPLGASNPPTDTSEIPAPPPDTAKAKADTPRAARVGKR